MALSAGTRLGPYEILAQIGAGGMGVVYSAKDLKLGRTVALKFLPPELTADPAERARMLREARAASRLDHPNIGTIYSIEGSEDDQVFIVMACYEGETLRSRIRRGGFLESEIFAISTQIAEGLGEAHSKHVIHRDIKPSNVILTTQGVVKIIDFGLARLLDLGTQTDSGHLAGTAAYMSPEQAKGKPADERSDLWALGVVIYEMLTGHCPFQGDTTPALLYAIVHEAPPISGEVMGRWSPLLERMLAKDPAQRYQSSGEFVNALKTPSVNSLAETQTVPEAVESAGPTGRPRFRVKRVAAATLGLAAVMSVGWYLARSSFRVAPASPKRVAVLPFRNLNNDPVNQVTSDGLLETLSSRLSDLDSSGQSLLVVPASEVRRRNVTDPAGAARQLGVNYVVTGSVQHDANTIRLTVNLVDARYGRQIASTVISDSAGSYYALQDSAVLKLAGLLHVGVGSPPPPTAPAGYQLYVEGMGYLHRWDQYGNLDKAIVLFRKVAGDDPNFHLGLAGLAEAYRLHYVLDHGQKWVALAQDAANHAIRADPKLEPVYVTLGRIHNSIGQDELAREEFERALSLAPHDAEAIQGMAQTYQRLGRDQEAEKMFIRAIALRPDSWEGYFRLGNFYYALRRYPAAEKQYRRVLELTPENANAYTNLGTVLTNENRYAEARAVLQQAVRLNPTYSAYNNLANVYYLEGRYNDSAVIYEKALSLNHDDYMVWGNLGAAYAASPALANKSESAFRQAAALAEQKAKETPEGIVQSELGGYYAHLKMPEKARVRLESALTLAPADSTVLLNVAEGFAILGDRVAAARELQNALKSGSSLEYAKRIPALKEIASSESFK